MVDNGVIGPLYMRHHLFPVSARVMVREGRASHTYCFRTKVGALSWAESDVKLSASNKLSMYAIVKPRHCDGGDPRN